MATSSWMVLLVLQMLSVDISSVSDTYDKDY